MKGLCRSEDGSTFTVIDGTDRNDGFHNSRRRMQQSWRWRTSYALYIRNSRLAMAVVVKELSVHISRDNFAVIYLETLPTPKKVTTRSRIFPSYRFPTCVLRADEHSLTQQYSHNERWAVHAATTTVNQWSTVLCWRYQSRTKFSQEIVRCSVQADVVGAGRRPCSEDLQINVPAETTLTDAWTINQTMPDEITDRHDSRPKSSGMVFYIIFPECSTAFWPRGARSLEMMDCEFYHIYPTVGCSW